MKLCRFKTAEGAVRIGRLQKGETVADLTAAGFESLAALLEDAEALAQAEAAEAPSVPLVEVSLLTPVERQEVWAAGVTYLRSKKARMEESDFSANAYDQVYDAPRPEIFLKSLPEKVVHPGDSVGIRADASWNVPEPELTLVVNSRKELVGVSIGNDMSSRDIEGENLLYLPQAKTYDRSCSLGPWMVLGVDEMTVRNWTIGVHIFGNEQSVFCGETSISLIKRSFDDLAGYLFRSQRFPHGAVLMTGTGVVPNDDFTLEEGDRVDIHVSGIGTLSNSVVRV
mgnify:CR=1 FL=1